MCNSADRPLELREIALWEKTGGRSGHYRRGAATAAPATGVDGAGSAGISSGDVVDDIDQLLGSDFTE
jgi:hypothetical protein